MSTDEEPQDVLDRCTPEQRAVVQAYRSAVARKAGRAGRGQSKVRTTEQCRKAQKAAMAARMAKVKTTQSEAA